jgi:hypothetical protein
MVFSHSQSLEGVLKVIAEAPIHELISFPSQLLQEVRDKLSRAILFDHETEISSESAVNQARQSFPQQRRFPKTTTDFSISRQVPQPKPTPKCTPGPSAEGFDENGKANRLFTNLLEQITNVSRLLKKNAEEVLRDGIHQCHEDPRITDIGKMVNPTVSDELRFILGCLTLSDDFERFQEPAGGKRTVRTSQRSFGATLGLNETHAYTLRYGIDCGRKVRTLLDCGNAVIIFLLFVKWHRAEEQEMTEFGLLCGAEENVKKLIPVAQKFMSECFDVYLIVLQERRAGKSQQCKPRKRKRIADASVIGQDTDRSLPPSHSMLGLPVEANSTHQLLSGTPVPTHGVLIGKTNPSSIIIMSETLI